MNRNLKYKFYHYFVFCLIEKIVKTVHNVLLLKHISLIVFYSMRCFMLLGTNLSSDRVTELLKDIYQGCSLFGNDVLFNLSKLIVEYDVQSHYKSVWLDIGANQGLFSKYVADTVYNSNIYSFEPFYPVFKRLQWRFKDYDNVKVYLLFNLLVI